MPPRYQLLPTNSSHSTSTLWHRIRPFLPFALKPYQFLVTIAALCIIPLLYINLPWSTRSPYVHDPSIYTSVLGGLPGFWVFENVWYHDRTFYMHGPHWETLPKKEAVLSEDSGDVKMVVSENPQCDQRPDVIFKGTSLLIDEGAKGGWNGLWHYYHFAAEDLLSGFATMAAEGYSNGGEGAVYGESNLEGRGRTIPDRLILPWDQGWKDKWGMNELVVDGIFGGDGDFIDKEHWDRETEGRWTYFEKLVLIDRWASHELNPDTSKWNKMAVPIFEHPHSTGFWNQAREKLLRHYSIPIHTDLPRPPKVVYVDRQTTDRRLHTADHEALVELLRDMERRGRIQFLHATLEEMTGVEQIKTVSDASIMLGIHGNGLTHELWLPEKGSLIELFPNEMFLRDYACVAEVLGHHYTAIRNDTILTRDEWMGIGHEQNPGKAHDGTRVYVSDASPPFNIPKRG